MKCAKCGFDIDPKAPSCPHCAAGEVKPDASFQSGTHGGWRGRRGGSCPACGSQHIFPVRRAFDPGCGCLGVLLFGWLGLLLGLLGAGQVEMVCSDCGAKWSPGKTGELSGLGCSILILITIGLLFLIGMGI